MEIYKVQSYSNLKDGDENHGLMGQEFVHPRIYVTNGDKAKFLKTIDNVDWKKELVDKKVENLEKYLAYCEEDPTWLVSRLQMNWKTKHDKVFLNGGDFSHSEGSAPVPTVRYSGTRDWATDYRRPKLNDIKPYFDDPRGLYLEHKNTGKKEWIHPSEAGFAIEKVNQEIMQLVEDAAFLFWLTGKQKYAEFATPVFFTYINGMHHREAPIDLKNSNQQHISGLATFEVIHESIVISLVTAYDFLYNYFESENKDLSKTTSVFQKWGDQIIEKGIPDNNWNLFQARFLTYLALVLEGNDSYKNKKGREHYLDYTFNISTDRQIAVNESLLVYDYETGIWPESPVYGDWANPRKDEGSHTPEAALFNNCYYVYVLKIAANIAEILEMEEVASKYKTKATEISGAVNHHFYNPNNYTYIDSRQTHLVLPLIAGVVPENDISKVETKLKEEILVSQDGHFDTGIHGTYFLVKYLTKKNNQDLLYTLTSQTTYPSYGEIIERGEITWPEYWSECNSRVHGCLNGIGGWFQRGILGIQPDPKKVGYKEFIVRPAFHDSLQWAKGHHVSPYGNINVSWKKTDKIYSLELTVPDNTIATVFIPAKVGSDIWENNKPIASAKEIQLLGFEHNIAELKLGSGTYQFKVVRAK
jgi:hypothetical protein